MHPKLKKQIYRLTLPHGHMCISFQFQLFVSQLQGHFCLFSSIIWIKYLTITSRVFSQGTAYWRYAGQKEVLLSRQNSLEFAKMAFELHPVHSLRPPRGKVRPQFLCQPERNEGGTTEGSRAGWRSPRAGFKTGDLATPSRRPRQELRPLRFF